MPQVRIGWSARSFAQPCFVRRGRRFKRTIRHADDLRTALGPFFKAGLENNERSPWVTAEPLKAEEGARGAARLLPDFDALEKKGQIGIQGADSFYDPDNEFQPAKVVDADRLTCGLSDRKT
jgi:hypothetical protein